MIHEMPSGGGLAKMPREAVSQAGWRGALDAESIGSMFLVCFSIFTYPNCFRESFGDALTRRIKKEVKPA